MTQARQTLTDLYLDWVNNYLTIEVFAEHNELSKEHATQLIALGKAIFESPHPES